MSTELVTWRELISAEMRARGDAWENVVGQVLGPPQSDDYRDEDERTEPSLDTRFYDGYGGEEGCAFTVWTLTRVYFPAKYDGSEWCASVPRFPESGAATQHIGGG